MPFVKKYCDYRVSSWNSQNNVIAGYDPQSHQILKYHGVAGQARNRVVTKLNIVL